MVAVVVLVVVMVKRADVDDVGDHAMPEHSVLRSSDELRWAHVVLRRRTQTIYLP